MTKRKNLTKGQRNELLENTVQQLQQSTRIIQMVMQQTGKSLQSIQKDMSELASRQRELQYRLKAYQEITDTSMDDVNAKAELLQIADFDEFSAKEDEENGYTETDVVAEDSVVIFTTVAEENQGFLRSKQAYSDIGFPKLKEDLLGKKAGDSFDIDVNGTEHKLTVLGVRKKPEEVSEDGTIEIPEAAADGPAVSAQA